MSTVPATRPQYIPIDHVVAAWLHAKGVTYQDGEPCPMPNRSAETARAYPRVMTSFRLALTSQHLDLDAADPRRLRQMMPDATNEAIQQKSEDQATAIAAIAQAWAAEGGVKPATHNRRLAIIGSFYTYALKQRQLHGPNPIASVGRLSVQAYANVRALQPEELARIDAISFDTDANLRDYTLLQIALHTGRRAHELAGMQRKDINQGKELEGAITITWPHVKGGGVMHDELEAASIPAMALRAWIRRANITDSHAPIWFSLDDNGTRGHQLSTRTISRICQRWLGTSKVHDLRHTFAHTMEDAGAKVSDIQERLGHKNIATTGRYLARLNGKNDKLEELTRRYGLRDRRSELQ